MDTRRTLLAVSKDLSIWKKWKSGFRGQDHQNPLTPLPAVPRGFRYLADSFVGNRLLAILFLVTSPCSAGKRDSGNNDKEPDDIVAAH